MLVCNALILALCLLFLSPKLANNDDFIIHGLTAGIYGVRSAATVHTNVVLATLLVWLQTRAPALNWFVTLEVFALFASVTAVSTLVWRHNPTVRGLLLALALALSAGPFFYTEIHNTKSTPLIAAAGLLLFIYGLRQRRKFSWICGALLAVFAAFLRLQAFLLGCAFAGGAILLLLFLPGEKTIRLWLKNNSRYIISLALLLAAVFALTGVDLLYAKTHKDVAYYRAYNAARGAVSDFDLADFDANYDAYRSLGLSRNDLEMIRNWSFDDPAQFDIDTLLAVAALPRGGPTTARRFTAGLQQVLSSDLFHVTAVVSTLSLLLFFLRGPRSLWRLVAILWPFAGLVVCLLFFSVIGRTTHWVLSGILGAALLSAFYAVDVETPQTKPLPRTLLCAAVLLLAAVGFGLYAAPRVRFDPNPPERVSAFNDVAADKAHLYVAELTTLPALDAMTPVFRAAPFGFFENLYFLGGWDSESPAKNSILTRFDIDGSVWEALARRDDVFLLDSFLYDQKFTYMRENYYADARAAMIGQLGGQYVFAFTRDIANYTENSTLTAYDLTAGTSAVHPDFVTVSLKINRELPDGAVVWFRIETDSGGQTYRTRVIQSADGTALTADIPYLDLSFSATYRLRVLLPTDAGSVEAAAALPFVFY